MARESQPNDGDRPINQMEFESVQLLGASVSVSVWPDGVGPVHVDTPTLRNPEDAQKETASGILPVTGDDR